jgi:hypothetical protein
MKWFARRVRLEAQLSTSRRTTVLCMATDFKTSTDNLGTRLHGAERDKEASMKSHRQRSPRIFLFWGPGVPKLNRSLIAANERSR